MNMQREAPHIPVTVIARQAVTTLPAPLSSESRPRAGAAAQEDRQAWLAADGAWHDTLYAAASNARARQIVSSVNAQWRCMQAGLFAMEERTSHSTAEHRAILDRVPSGDATGAARLLQERIGRTR